MQFLSTLPRFFVAALVLLTGCTAIQPPPTPTPAPEVAAPSAPVFIAQRGLVVRNIQFTGRVQPLQSTPLQFEVDGRVRKVNVRSGDTVKQGAVLAELDQTDLQTQLAQAELQFNTAQVVLSDTLQSFTRTLRVSQLDLEQSELRFSAATARFSRGNANLLASDLTRADQTLADLRAAQALTPDPARERQITTAIADRERIFTRLGEAQGDLRARQIELDLLKNEVERARLALEAKVQGLDPGKTQAVELARITVTALRAKNNKGVLLAPFDGQIVAQPLAVGETVKALEDTLVIAKPGDIEVVASLSELQLRELSVGQPISLSLASLPNQLVPATVSRVPLLTPSERDRFVRISLDPSLARASIATGTLARCNMELARRENVVWLAPQGIRNFRGRRFVIVQEPDGRQRRVDVIIGIESADRVEIVDGLQGGERILGPN